MIYTKKVAFKQANTYFQCEGCDTTWINSTCFETVDTDKPHLICLRCAKWVHENNPDPESKHTKGGLTLAVIGN